MKANYDVDKLPIKAEQELMEHWNAELKKASMNGFVLGGHTALKLAYDRFEHEVRVGTQKARLAAAEELLIYLESKSEGLKDVAKDE